MRTLVLCLLLVACSDDPGPGLADTCSQDSDCASGLCYDGACLDPAADLDQDGLSNQVERGLDTDEDGAPDIIESDVRDPDEDCLSDQADPDNDVAADPLYCEPEDESPLAVSGDDFACPADPNVTFSAYSADQNWTELVKWSAEIDGIPTNLMVFSAPGVATISASAPTGTKFTAVAATRQNRATMDFFYTVDDGAGACQLPD